MVTCSCDLVVVVTSHTDHGTVLCKQHCRADMLQLARLEIMAGQRTMSGMIG